jgi:hypothetical protein
MWENVHGTVKISKKKKLKVNFEIFLFIQNILFKFVLDFFCLVLISTSVKKDVSFDNTEKKN